MSTHADVGGQIEGIFCLKAQEKLNLIPIFLSIKTMNMFDEIKRFVFFYLI